MDINIKLGKYEILRRTPYSKIQIFDNEQKKDISDTAHGKIMAEKIIKDYITQQDKDYFEIEGNALHKINGNNVDYLFIPNEIEKISMRALSDQHFAYIVFPNKLKHIGIAAIQDCTHLKEIILPNEVSEIEAGVFAGCTSLTKAVLSDKMGKIPLYTFMGCTSLKEIIIPDNIKIISECAFQGCKSLKKINIPKNFEKFGSTPFLSSEIETLVFNHNLEDKKDPRMSYKNFLLSSKITKIEISNNVSHIDPEMFSIVEGKIKEIIYKGTSKEFEKFKRKNKKLFKVLKDVKIEIKENLKDIIDKNMESFNENKASEEILER